MRTLEEAQAALARANDAELPMEERQAALSEADEIRKGLSLSRSKIGTWPEWASTNGNGSTTAPKASRPAKTAGKAAKAPKAAKPAKAAEPAKELTPGIIYLRNDVQKALFEQIIRPNIVGKGGRWAGPRPANHHRPWEIAQVAVDEKKVGITFADDARKRNYNLNDSNWLQPETTKKLIKVASAAAGKELTKKEVVEQLVDMKAIFQTNVKPHQPTAS